MVKIWKESVMVLLKTSNIICSITRIIDIFKKYLFKWLHALNIK
jgi:hypothetical protein